MNDTLITIIAILLAAILMFVFPLLTTADKVDKVAQVELQTAANDFINNVKQKGKITKEDYDKFTAMLPSQNTYDIEVEVYRLDENTNKKESIINSKKIGENTYVGTFTTDVLDQINKVGEYPCLEGDIVKVSVRNTNQTLSQQLSLTPNADISVNSASASATITFNGN